MRTRVCICVYACACVCEGAHRRKSFGAWSVNMAEKGEQTSLNPIFFFCVILVECSVVSVRAKVHVSLTDVCRAFSGKIFYFSMTYCQIETLKNQFRT